MTEITPEELGERLSSDRNRPLVVDIRNRKEFKEWHIPGSENIAVYDEFGNDPDVAKEALSAVPEDREVVTVCVAGVVAQRATDYLATNGYDAKTLVGGMNGWSRVHRSAPVQIDIPGHLIQVARPGKGCLSYILVSDGEAAVFDPSHYPAEYQDRIDAHDAELIGVFDTHAHADHISGGQDLADRHGVPYYLHPADAQSIDATALADDQVHSIGAVEVRVIHTPGHSPGGVSFSIEGEALITGDTLFHRSVGRVELGVEAGIEDTDVESNAETLYESLQRLLDQDGDPIVLPAHDPGSPEPPVTVRLSDVRAHNRDLTRDRTDFIETLASDVPDHPPNFQRIKRLNVETESVEHDELSALELGPNRCAAE